MRSLLLAPVLLLSGGCIVIDELDCRHQESRSATLPAAGIVRVEVRALAGSLEIHGQPDAGTIDVRGVACARRSRDLEGIEIATRVEGDLLVIETILARAASHRGSRLDLEVGVPAAMRVEVDDGSGDVEVADVAALEIDDGSGDLFLERVAGEVSIRDHSGDIVVEGAGPVRIDDDSGDLVVRDAAAVTVLDDGSGDILISRIKGDVIIVDDGSGDVEIAGVGGGLTVEHDGSGDVEYSDVAGAIDVPGRREAGRDDRSLPAEAPEPEAPPAEATEAERGD
jgi:hypothetical protein